MNAATIITLLRYALQAIGGYLVANGDFIEPVGPAFWERKS